MPTNELSDNPTAVPFYTREDFDTVWLPLSERNDPISYDNWLIRVERMEQTAKHDGAISRRIPIKPDALKVWCQEQKLAICRKSIGLFAMFTLGDTPSAKQKLKTQAEPGDAANGRKPS